MPTQGYYLAELPRHFHELRATYLEWAKTFGQPAAVGLAHYRRALIGWYEAVKHPTDAYTGEVYHYVTTAADVYFSGEHRRVVEAMEGNELAQASDTFGANPLNHLPQPIALSETQQLMLRQFHELGKRCRELLLLADYHDLTPGRIAEALDMDGRVDEVQRERRKCLLLVRERWQATGILDPVIVPSPQDEQLIDRYYDGKLDMTERWEVEARRPSDSVFRQAMELREDWMEVITVAGRQDLMETLQREENRYAEKVVAPPPSPAPAAPPRVRLSRRKTRLERGIGALDFWSVIAVAVLLAFGYVAYTTFGTGPTGNALFEEYFEPLDSPFVRRVPETEDERDFDRMLYYYERGDYATAYDEMLPAAEVYPGAALYLGISAMALGDHQRAQDWLARVERTDPYYAYAEWYEALGALARDRTPSASAILEDIADRPGHPYRSRAAALLREL